MRKLLRRYRRYRNDNQSNLPLTITLAEFVVRSIIPICVLGGVYFFSQNIIATTKLTEKHLSAASKSDADKHNSEFTEKYLAPNELRIESRLTTSHEASAVYPPNEKPTTLISLRFT